MLKQTELPLEVPADPETLPIPVPDEMKSALLDWSEAVADVIDGIGPPGDFGYGSKRGDALHHLIQIVDEIHAIIAGRRNWTRRKQRGAPTTLRSAVAAVEKLTWPKDVKYRLPRFYVALASLQQKTQLVEEVAR